MLISCKVTNSVLRSLERQGRDLSTLLQSIDVPEEFLTDSSCWLEAPRMEAFLREIDMQFLDLPENYLREVGRQCESLRSWGVLDSVLKMMESPLDIYGQPSRFLSYFISPEPPIGAWKHLADPISFQLPVSSQQYPYITQYLAGALEGLPVYMRKAMAQVQWEDSTVFVSWKDLQGDLLCEEDRQLRQFNPQWVRTMIDSLEQQQRQLEGRQAQIQGPLDMASVSPLTDEVKALKTSLQEAQQGLQQMLEDVLATKSDFLKLHDYFARSQQLITFLIHSGRKTKQVDEAMRRMDWNHVQSSYDHMVEEACDRLLATKQRAQNLVSKFEPFKPIEQAPEDSEPSELQLPIH